MNFLAHLHIADHNHSSLEGNLLGDFVKGNPEGKYPQPIIDGIRLHRYIDRLTDTHPLVLEQKQKFPQPLKRFCPIALDMFWDHCLAVHWSRFHEKTLEQFIQYCREHCQTRDYAVPERYLTMTKAMWQGGWLSSYQDIDNILYALERMSLRRVRMAPLATCGASLVEHYDELTHVFLRLYPEVLKHSKIFTINQIKV